MTVPEDVLRQRPVVARICARKLSQYGIAQQGHLDIVPVLPDMIPGLTITVSSSVTLRCAR